MKNPRLVSITLATLAMLATQASPTIAQSLPPVRQLRPLVTKSALTVPGIAGVRELPHGRVLVNDTVTRRLYLFDSPLTSRMVVLDSTEGSKSSYGDFPGGMIAYRADSTLFVDPSFASMLLIDPAGKVARTVAGSSPVELLFLAGGTFGTPGFDARGRLVYRGSARDRTPRRAGTISPYPEKDSAPIVRLDLITGHTDTIAHFKIPNVVVTITEEPDGRFRTAIKKHLLPTIDDWVVLPNGSLALVRGGDFHIDWIDQAGKHSSSARIPFPWRRLSHDAKVAFMDSVRFASDTAIAAQKIRLAERFYGTGIEPPEPIEPEYGSLSGLPDAFPAFEPNSTRADPYGIIWIRTTQLVNGRPVYYLVNRRGSVIDRVQLPSGRIIAGFGRNHTVYLSFIDPAGGVRLERSQVR
ncbi:MAG: hypothetical protein M3P26_03580 [Gemmatimonadota bacterium]|nr:hypothetical protein [Gemmatimonadota bacterium]